MNPNYLLTKSVTLHLSASSGVKKSDKICLISNNDEDQ